MPRSSSAQVTDRILRLAAYIDKRREFTLEQATTDVEGYRTDDKGQPKGHEAIRASFGRDLDVLRAEFGIEVRYDADRARYGLLAPFFMPAERRALIAAAGAVAITLEGEGDSDPEAIGAAVDDDRAEVFLTVTADALTLLEAQLARKPVRFTYKDKERHVEPWAVGTWRRHWYLVGNDRDGGPGRRFRVDRIGDLAVVDGAFEVPAEFDSESAFDMDPNSWGQDPRVRVRIEVEPAFADRLADAVGGEVMSHSAPAAIVEVDNANRDALIDRLLEFGPRARVVAPTEVVEQVLMFVRAMAGD
jgi:hypothetical protein